MERFRLQLEGIIADVYQAKKSSNACLYFYGFPATIGSNELTEFLTDNNYCVIQPHYNGTYDSDSFFTPQSALQLAKKIGRSYEYNDLINLKNDNKITLPPIKLVVAHSFGCFIAIRSLKALPSIETVLLFSPALTYGDSHTPSGFHESGPKFLEYIKKSRPFTYRLGEDDEWMQFYQGKLNDVPLLQSCKIKQVIGVVGGKDSSFDLATLKNNFENIIKNIVGEVPSVKLITIEEGSHSINSLLTEELSEQIKKYI